MLGGAVIGAWLVIEVAATAALALTTALLALVTLGVALAARRPAPWRRPHRPS